MFKICKLLLNWQIVPCFVHYHLNRKQGIDSYFQSMDDGKFKPFALWGVMANCGLPVHQRENTHAPDQEGTGRRQPGFFLLASTHIVFQ